MMGCSIASQLHDDGHVARHGPIRSASHCCSPAARPALRLRSSALNWIEPRTSRWLFGAFLAGYAAYLLLRRTAAAEAGAAAPGACSRLFVGAVGGLVGVFTAMPGAIPSIWCELRGCSKDEQRGQVQPFILGMQILALMLARAGP